MGGCARLSIIIITVIVNIDIIAVIGIVAIIAICAVKSKSRCLKGIRMEVVESLEENQLPSEK